MALNRRPKSSNRSVSSYNFIRSRQGPVLAIRLICSKYDGAGSGVVAGRADGVLYSQSPFTGAKNAFAKLGVSCFGG